MTNKQDLFDQRYRKVLDRHRELSRGYVTKLGKNGVIAHHPISHYGDALQFKALLLPIGLLFFLKACVVTILNEDVFTAQVDLLREGTFIEQVGAFLMQIDPITWVIAQGLGAIIG
jgi:hypothetical protein